MKHDDNRRITRREDDSDTVDSSGGAIDEATNRGPNKNADKRPEVDNHQPIAEGDDPASIPPDPPAA